MFQQDTTIKELLHDGWLLVTFASIAGWTVLLLSLRDVLTPLKRIWPQLYRVLQMAVIAILGVIVEMGCADVAAYFYEPVITDARNLYIRLAGRGVEALAVWLAVIYRLVIKMGKANGN